jgi:hypothetical protein
MDDPEFACSRTNLVRSRFFAAGHAFLIPIGPDSVGSGIDPPKTFTTSNHHIAAREQRFEELFLVGPIPPLTSYPGGSHKTVRTGTATLLQVVQHCVCRLPMLVEIRPCPTDFGGTHTVGDEPAMMREPVAWRHAGFVGPTLKDITVCQ